MRFLLTFCEQLFSIVFFLTLFAAAASAQTTSTHNIKEQKGLFGDRCRKYRIVSRSLPDDVRLDVFVDGRTIWFATPSLEHFNRIFDKRGDGITVDIVQSDQYDCNEKAVLSPNTPARGYLMPPMYKKEMLKKMQFDKLNNVMVRYGVLPSEFDPSQVECNLMVLQKKALCDYSLISGFDFGTWDLLETGLFWEDVPESGDTAHVQHAVNERVAEFTIFFDKNKSTLDSSQVKPLLDTLRFSSGKLHKISVVAYSSMEGTVTRNEMLQRRRAENIINALAKYQTEEVVVEIRTEENKDEFINDVAGTEYSYLVEYPGSKLREVLSTDPRLLASLEPVLASHRKAVVKLTFRDANRVDAGPLKALFHKSLGEPELSHALVLQKRIFDKIRGEQLPHKFIEELEIPGESRYGPLFTNIILFNMERLDLSKVRTVSELEELAILMPDDPKIKYNILTLKLQLWAQTNNHGYDRASIEQLLREVDRSSLERASINRVKINYHLLLTQYLTYEKKFREKRKSVKTIYHYYSKIELTDDEVLSLARFLAFYSEFKMASDLLYTRLAGSNPSEELVFYWLKLNMSNNRKIEGSEFKRVTALAIAANRRRYCDLFRSRPEGGLSFQLKAIEPLRTSYCDFCN